MKMKGFLSKLAALTLVLGVTASSFSFIAPKPAIKVMAASEEDKDIADEWTKLESDNIADKVEIPQFSLVAESGAKETGEGIVLPVDGIVQFDLNVPAAGRYNIVLQYRIDSDKVLKNTVYLSWNGGGVLASVPALWKDNDKQYEKDRYGNDIVPDQKVLDSMHLEYVKNYAILDKKPVVFELEKGKQSFQIKNNTQPLVLSSVYLVEETENISYKDYSKESSGKDQGGDFVIVEAEAYNAKSDSFIRPANVQNPGLYPYDTDNKLLNVIDGNSWRDNGQKILWDFEVETSGLYSIGFRYAQNTKEGMSVFRNIEIDGKVPFAEMRNYPFKYTGLGYKNLILADKQGESFKLWLEKGKHTISMEADGGPVESIVDNLRKIMLEINDTGIDIKKLTGGNDDANRTWNVVEYMPDIEKRLNDWADSINELYKQLEKVGGEKPVFAVNLKMAEKNLRDIAKEPNKIPSRLSKLSEGSGSVSQLIGDLNLELTRQPLSIDRIYIADNEKLPKANAGFFKKMWEGVKRFFISFLPKTRGFTNVSADSKELSVWVNRPIQYVELLQQIADSDFTKETGVEVKFSVMPNEQKLVLANASRTNPDVALGISNHIPYQLAIRGAAADMVQFDDFLSYISREHNLETLIPYCMEDGIYGVTETQDFYVLMYRKDIMDKLNLDIPQTWDDVKEMMPELQRHSMNFFVPMASWSGLKPFYTTSPFIFQNGGSIYSEDGLTTAINSENSIKGFELMTELFNIYSVAENVPNFYNNFRYGTVPIGVANFGAYVTLTNAAPEIAGLWDIALSPGVKDANGNIVRTEIAADRADIIFENSDKKEQSWELLKWWLSKETQIKYAYSLQTRFGPEYMWNTSNMAAFEELPFPEKDKKVILEQWKTIKEVAPHPASYMVEREISNAWTDIVMNGLDTRIAVDKAVMTANREIKRKLEEFGYIKDGKVVREYHIPTVEDIREKVKESK